MIGRSLCVRYVNARIMTVLTDYSLNAFVVTNATSLKCYLLISDRYYPHMPMGKVWIYRLLFVFMCVFVCLYGYGLVGRG